MTEKIKKVEEVETTKIVNIMEPESEGEVVSVSASEKEKTDSESDHNPYL